MSHLKLVLVPLLYIITCECRIINNKLPEFDNRILNGERANDYQFPYQVSLQLNTLHHCGGSILSEVKVLTAGHCVMNRAGRPLSKENLRILAGSNYLNNTDTQNYYTVKEFSIHPKYVPVTVQYDNAVVFIHGYFDFKLNNVESIALPTRKPRPGEVCYVSGWGDVTTSYDKRTPNELQFAKITIDPPNVCVAIFPKYFKSSHMVCAGQLNKENAGSGDSGGPLACNNYLTGVVSFGCKLYDSNFPDVYSCVFYASEWINTTNGTKVNEVIGLISVIIFSVAIIL